VSFLPSLRRVPSARFTQLTSRVVGRYFRGPFEEQALRTPFSSQPDSFWFESPLLAFRPPLQPKLLRYGFWQLERLSAPVPSPVSRSFLQGFAGRLRTQYLAMVGSGPSLTLGVNFRDSESYPTRSLRLRFASWPAFLKLFRSPSTFSAFRATSARLAARTTRRSVPRSLPSLRYSACSLIPKNEAGFLTRCTPAFPSCVKILFQIGNAPGVPRSPHPFAPSAPKSFLCAVLLAFFPPESGSPAGLRCHDLGVVQLLKEQQTFIPFASSANTYTSTAQKEQALHQSNHRKPLCLLNINELKNEQTQTNHTSFPQVYPGRLVASGYANRAVL
jgi:hypothetical protein